MAAIEVPHLITIEGQRARISLPDEYSEIGTIVGIVRDTTNPPEPAIPATVHALIKGKGIIRIRCGVAVGGRRKTRTVLCSVTNLGAALGSLIGKILPGSAGEATIKTTNLVQKRRLG